ncbi:hypothetical protein J6590_074171 [Homalodisca vitripennis]|nr:hypothetical protein J6590_074171 [Homalodisca vitripennis]
MRRLFLNGLLLLCCSLAASDSNSSDTGADFLQSVIQRMQHEKFINSDEDLIHSYRPTPVPQQYESMAGSGEGPHQDIPPLSKGELLALYQAAVAKGTGLDLASLPTLPLTSDIHQNHDDLVSPSDQGTLPGYYYYFYPIKSFLPNSSNEQTTPMMNSSEQGSASHMPMHMMMMDDGSAMMEDMKETRLDPLFLAMAGFVSMATIVSFSILFLPKFGDNRSRQKAALKTLAEDEEEMVSLSRVVGQAIQGRDCTDRLACELGRAILKMKLGQKPLR